MGTMCLSWADVKISHNQKTKVKMIRNNLLLLVIDSPIARIPRKLCWPWLRRNVVIPCCFEPQIKNMIKPSQFISQFYKKKLRKR